MAASPMGIFSRRAAYSRRSPIPAGAQLEKWARFSPTLSVPPGLPVFGPLSPFFSTSCFYSPALYTDGAEIIRLPPQG